VLHGQCLLIADEEEHALRQWDVVHLPAGVAHVFVGAGDGPCAVLMIGSRRKDAVHFPWRSGFRRRQRSRSTTSTTTTPGKPIIQVDVDAPQLGKFHPVTVPVWGEIGVVLAGLRERVSLPPADRVDQRPELAERWAIWRAEQASHERDDRGHGVNSAVVFAALGRHVPENGVIAVDVGNHA
jgi:thiamine pyrophosphate-dependent acetolactate synthase large subunit-like protein